MRGLVLAGIAAAFIATGASARDVVPAEERTHSFDAQIPGCEDTKVLEKISSRFAEREGKFWNSGLTLVGFEKIRPTAWRPWGLDYIPRRFCSGTVTVSDGRKSRIDYSIREDLGIIGVSWGVEWCIQTLDRNWAYSPHCRMARP